MTLAPDGTVIIGVASLGSPTSRIVLLKVDPLGNEIWQVIVGLAGAAAWNFTALSDGGYIVSGRTDSSASMLKTGAEGQALWQRTFGAYD